MVWDVPTILCILLLHKRKKPVRQAEGAVCLEAASISYSIVGGDEEETVMALAKVRAESKASNNFLFEDNMSEYEEFYDYDMRRESTADQSWKVKASPASPPHRIPSFSEF
jgi:hypothetical protein